MYKLSYTQNENNMQALSSHKFQTAWNFVITEQLCLSKLSAIIIHVVIIKIWHSWLSIIIITLDSRDTQSMFLITAYLKVTYFREY